MEGDDFGACGGGELCGFGLEGEDGGGGGLAPVAGGEDGEGEAEGEAGVVVAEVVFIGVAEGESGQALAEGGLGVEAGGGGQGVGLEEGGVAGGGGLEIGVEGEEGEEGEGLECGDEGGDGGCGVASGEGLELGGGGGEGEGGFAEAAGGEQALDAEFVEVEAGEFATGGCPLGGRDEGVDVGECGGVEVDELAGGYDVDEEGFDLGGDFEAAGVELMGHCCGLGSGSAGTGGVDSGPVE